MRIDELDSLIQKEEYAAAEKLIVQELDKVPEEKDKKGKMRTVLFSVFKTDNLPENMERRIQLLEYIVERPHLKNILDLAVNSLFIIYRNSNHFSALFFIGLKIEGDAFLDFLLLKTNYCGQIALTLKKLPTPEQIEITKRIMQHGYRKNYMETLDNFNQIFLFLNQSNLDDTRLKKLTSLSPESQKKFINYMNYFINGFGKLDYNGGKIALAQIAARKKYPFNPTLLNGGDEFIKYLNEIKEAKLPAHERFIIASNHWLCGEIRIDKNGKVNLILLDSFGIKRLYIGQYVSLVTSIYPDCVIYTAADERQRSRTGCSFYSLEDLRLLHTLQNFLEYAAEFGQDTQYDIPTDKPVMLKKFRLPLSLMRTSQYPDLISETIPARLKGCDLYLISKFDIEKCAEIKGNAVILTDTNTAYFIIEGSLAMKDGEPQVIKNINRLEIEPSDSKKPIQYTASAQKKADIIKESTSKGGHAHLQPEEDRPVNKAKETVIQSIKKHWVEYKDPTGKEKILNLRLKYKLEKMATHVADFLLAHTPEQIEAAKEKFTLAAFKQRITSPPSVQSTLDVRLLSGQPQKTKTASTTPTPAPTPSS